MQQQQEQLNTNPPLLKSKRIVYAADQHKPTIWKDKRTLQQHNTNTNPQSEKPKGFVYHTSTQSTHNLLKSKKNLCSSSTQEAHNLKSKRNLCRSTTTQTHDLKRQKRDCAAALEHKANPQSKIWEPNSNSTFFFYWKRECCHHEEEEEEEEEALDKTLVSWWLLLHWWMSMTLTNIKNKLLSFTSKIVHYMQSCHHCNNGLCIIILLYYLILDT